MPFAQCRGRARYSTIWSAQASADDRLLQGLHQVPMYYCQLCRGWHLDRPNDDPEPPSEPTAADF